MYREDAPKQVIIIRKDLNMRKGKMIAQGAHASMKAIFDLMWNQNHWWTENTIKCLCVKPDSPLDLWVNGIFKKIVVGAENLNEMVEAYNEAKKTRNYLFID